MADTTEADSLTLNEKLLYGLGGLILTVGGILIGSKIIKGGIANNEENKTLNEGSSAAYAKAIRMAFDNDGYWGTNTVELRNNLRRIPTKNDFKDVVKSYHKLYNSNLLKDMSDELQSTEYNEMLEIIAAKPDSIRSNVNKDVLYESWAKRLKASFDKSYGFMPGTDEEAIKAVFNEIPTQNDFQQVAKVYQNEYSKNLMDDLKSELEFWEYDSYLNIIYSKPKT
jgi:hypothetical protein